MSCGDTATFAVRSATSASGSLAVGRRGIRQRFSSGSRHPLRTAARDVVILYFFCHIYLPRLDKNNLLSTSKFIDAGYAWLFYQDEVSIYDKRNTKTTMYRAAVLKGWGLPEENIWRIPLLPTANETDADVDERTANVAVSPQDILRANPPTITEQINSVYDLKTKP